jgi:uncharacterized coiled-coil DUF342 family protein
MNINILTKVQAQAYIRQEIAKQIIPIFKEFDKIRKEINLMKEEIICLQKK